MSPYNVTCLIKLAKAIRVQVLTYPVVTLRLNNKKVIKTFTT